MMEQHLKTSTPLYQLVHPQKYHVYLDYTHIRAKEEDVRPAGCHASSEKYGIAFANLSPMKDVLNTASLLSGYTYMRF